jgi:hypothetical protein
MLCKAFPIAHGNHGNVHIKVLIGGTKKHPMHILRLVALLDSEKAYILNSNIQKECEKIYNFDGFKEVIQNQLNKLDYELVLFNKLDFFNKGLKTIDILNKL